MDPVVTAHPSGGSSLSVSEAFRQSPGYGVRVTNSDASRHAVSAGAPPLVAVSGRASDAEPIVMRRVIGEQLRNVRQSQGRTLREVSGQARVSLGYLSEVERGQKEASSELLAAICGALDVPLSHLLRRVSDDLAVAESRVAVANGSPVVFAA